MKNIILKIVAFLFSVAIGFFGTGLIIGNNDASGEQEQNVAVSQVAASSAENNVPQQQVQNNNVTQQVEEKIAPQPIDVEYVISGKSLKQTGFGFTVTAQNVPEGVKIERFDLFTKDDSIVPVKSAPSNGIFSDVAYASNDGVYMLRGITADKNVTLFKEISGFVKPVEVKKIEKMTVAELQGLFDNIEKNYLWCVKHEKIAKGVKITAITDGSEKSFETLTQLKNTISMLHQKVSVLNVGYDSSNKINKISVELK